MLVGSGKTSRREVQKPEAYNLGLMELQCKFVCTTLNHKPQTLNNNVYAQTT